MNEKAPNSLCSTRPLNHVKKKKIRKWLGYCQNLDQSQFAECCRKLGFRSHIAAADQKSAREKPRAEGALQKASKPSAVIFTFEELPPPPVSTSTTCIPVDTTSVHSLLSHASSKEHIFFLQPLTSNESFGFRPSMVYHRDQRPLEGKPQIWGKWRNKKLKNWNHKNIYLGKWLGKMNSMELSTMSLISSLITDFQGS